MTEARRPTPPEERGALEALALMREGLLSSEELVSACLKRIEATEGTVRAWAHLDPEAALKQAREADAIRKAGRPVGALHGIPVGLKDIIDTRDMPTQCGTEILEGRRPEADAALVDRLREAGAVIMGKTVTTELAFMAPAGTRNPHDPARTPGGSSSGSAAAVAACHVPLAVGTQTNGSVIRPASFCGCFGFKPGRGVISRRGVWEMSAALDQIGVFARGLEDAAALADALALYDPADPASYPRPRPQMLAGSRAEAPVEPAFAWLEMPWHARLDEDARAGFEELLEALGGQVDRLPPHERLTALLGVHRTIQDYEILHRHEKFFAENRDRLSPQLRETLARARDIPRDAYDEALQVKASAEAFFRDFFNDYDAIIAPAATGEAPPLSDGTTGDPVFCTLWSLCGLPAVSLPLLVGESGLPVGVQLIGAAEEDDRLMRTAGWLLNTLQQHAATDMTR